MYDSVKPHFLLAVWGILEQSVSVEMDRTRWINRVACSFTWINSLRFFISGNIWNRPFMLQQSVTSRNYSIEYVMDLRWFIRPLEFSSEPGTHSSGVQLLALGSELTSW